MKSKFFLMAMGLMLALCSYSSAQVPQLINYQGKLTASSGAPLTDTLQMVFSIYSDEGGTDLLWTETQPTVEVLKGVFNVLLGSVNPISYSVFDGSTRYLGVKVGGDPEITPRKPMVSVAYAYRAGSGQINCHDCDSIFVNVAGPDSVYSTSGTAFLGKASGSSAFTMEGIEGYADNTSNGDAYGGYFSTSSSGTGNHIGVWGRTEGSASSTYGLCGSAFGTSTGYAYGVTGYGQNTSTGPAYGGSFSTSTAGTGTHYGVMTFSYGSSSNSSYGFWSQASNDGSGPTYGAYLTAPGGGTGTHYGIFSWAYGSSTSSTFGCDIQGRNGSTGIAIGGEFSTTDEGTGTHYGINASGYSSSSATAYGTYGYASNSSTGNAYAGYFSASSSGTGTHYGVYGAETAGGSGAAVYASGDFAGSGAKYAVVKTGKGNRLLSVIESPEIWFEDFGEGRLVNGKAHVELDPLFLETVTISADHPMKVFVQLTSGDPMNVVVKKGLTGFDVVAENLVSMASFDWRIVAKRKGYETERMRETDVGYDDPTLYPELQTEIDKKHQEEKQQDQLEREKRQQEQEQRDEERKQMELFRENR
jgi:hypothetical protein